MKGAIWLSIGAWWVLVEAGGLADPWDPADPAPWHLQSVVVSDTVQPDPKPETGPQRGRFSYLHLQLRFRPELTERQLHQFRLVDKSGKTVAEVHGFYRDRKVLVFDGEWKDFEGLFLEGMGHREPLVAGPPASSAESPGPPPKPEAGARDIPREMDPPSAQPTERPTEPTEKDGAKPPAGPSAGGARMTASSSAGGAGSGGRPSGSAVPGGSGDAGDSSGSSAAGGATASAPRPRATGRQGAESGLANRGTSGGSIGGSGGTSGGADVSGGRLYLRGRSAEPESARPPPMMLYLSCADELGRGRIYQVDEFGAIRGLVTLPHAATGLALHHEPALVAVVPRAGGKVLRIDSAGKVSVIVENDPLMPQPVDVGIGPGSDEILVADRLAHVLASTTMEGEKVRHVRRFPLQASDLPLMWIAVAADKKVLYSTDMEPGVYRFALVDQSRQAPLLAKPGGVAADPASARWAAAQPPGEIVLFEGDSPRARLRPRAGRIVYRHGLLLFAPANRLVTAESVPAAASGVAIVEWTLGDGSARDLFAWRKEDILDLVVGPRMPWPPYEPDRRRGVKAYPNSPVSQRERIGGEGK